MSSSETYTVDDVKYAIQQLKSGKSDGDAGFYSDHVIHGGNKLYIYLCLLYNLMLTHANVSKCFLLATIVLIPKPNADLSKLCNYRGLALAFW